MDIQERIIKAKMELLGLKTRQKTQNDSYEFYTYQTNNLYDSSGARYKLEFCPEGKGDFVCQFIPAGLPAVLYNGVCQTDPANPLVCYVLMGAPYTTVPSWQQKVYIQCRTTIKGVLLVTKL